MQAQDLCIAKELLAKTKVLGSVYAVKCTPS